MARYDIGGMLARSGQAQGQQIASGFEQFGKGLGSMLTGVGTGLASRRERKDKEAAAQEAQALLQKYANNPAQLNALGQKYATEGNDALSKLFLDAAKTATKRQVAVLEEAGAQITATTERARTQGQLRDALMAAREREDTNAVRALSNRSMDPSEYLKSLVEAKKGSEAKGYKVEKNVIIDGKEKSVVEFFDAQGNFLNRKVIGEVAGDGADAETPRGRNDWTAPEIKAYTKTQEDQRKAGAEAIKYNDLLNETIQIAGEKGQVGGILGTVRDFVTADVAGLGDAITVHRSRLNEVRMQNAIALLPRGPASDRDVKLALDASVDPKNLSPEDRVSYIRGMKKIADAEKEYMDGKLRWIQQTGDALAFGYEQKVSLDGIKKQVEAFRTDNAAEVVVLEGELQKVKALANSGNEQQAKELLNYIKSIDSIGYLSLLEDQEAEQQRYDRFVEQNNIEFF